MLALFYSPYGEFSFLVLHRLLREKKEKKIKRKTATGCKAGGRTEDRLHSGASTGIARSPCWLFVISSFFLFQIVRSAVPTRPGMPREHGQITAGILALRRRDRMYGSKATNSSQRSKRLRQQWLPGLFGEGRRDCKKQSRNPNLNRFDRGSEPQGAVRQEKRKEKKTRKKKLASPHYAPKT